jgi:hypothetical protein
MSSLAAALPKRYFFSVLCSLFVRHRSIPKQMDGFRPVGEGTAARISKRWPRKSAQHLRPLISMCTGWPPKPIAGRGEWGRLRKTAIGLLLRLSWVSSPGLARNRQAFWPAKLFFLCRGSIQNGLGANGNYPAGANQEYSVYPGGVRPALIRLLARCHRCIQFKLLKIRLTSFLAAAPQARNALL